MEKRINSLKIRIEQLERENSRLKASVNLMLMEKKQWLESKEKFDTIIQQTIAGANVKNAAISEEMMLIREENRKLKEEIKTLKDG